MDSWNEQRELAKSRIAEIEDKIAQQKQKMERLLSQNDDASIPIRMTSVLQDSLARAKVHMEYVDQRIAAHKADSPRRRARAALINVAQIERKIADFDRQAKAIEKAIQTEEHRTGVHDPAHIAYPSAAKGMMEQRDKVTRLIEALTRELAHAKAAFDRARPAPPDSDSPPPAASA
jgi:DNA repair exonuclease SbcCD ATPase subunit